MKGDVPDEDTFETNLTGDMLEYVFKKDGTYNIHSSEEYKMWSGTYKRHGNVINYELDGKQGVYVVLDNKLYNSVFISKDI